MLRLANHYTVYALDSRSQGESGYTDEISYALMAKDVKQFVEIMGLEKPLVIGHSDGGIIAIQTAIRLSRSFGRFRRVRRKLVAKGVEVLFHDVREDFLQRNSQTA